MKKTLRVLFLTLLTALCLVSFASAASGTCGESLTWTLDEDTGVLTVSGEGYMPNWYWGEQTAFSAYRNSVVEAVLEEGVRNVSRYTFAQFENLQKVTLPESLESIGDGAFEECYALAEINLPKNLKTIGETAFVWCGFAELEIPASVTEIGSGAFASSVRNRFGVAEGSEHFKAVDGALLTADGAVLLSLPKGWVGEYTAPDGLRTVGDSAFAGCWELTAVTLPKGTKTIDNSAFQGAPMLKTVTLPSSITEVKDNAFGGYERDLEIYYPGTVEDLQARATIGTENDALLNAQFHTVESDGEEPEQTPGESASGTCGENLTWTFADGVLTVSGSGAMEDWLADEQPWWEFADGIAKVVIEDGVTSVGSSAFYTYYNLETVILGKDVETIGAFAFADCEKLTEITLPESIRTVNMAAFQNCTSLKWVENTAFITSLGAQALRNTALSTVDLTGVEEIFFGTMDSCDQLDTVILSEKLKAVGLGAFSGCSALTAVTFHGTQAQWDAITVDVDNDPLLSATVTCTVGEPEEEKPTVSGSVSNVVGGASVIIGGVETPVNEDGSFAIPVEGTFDVVIKVPGALSVTVKNVTAEDGSVTLPEIVPVKGDTNGDDMINIMDMAAFRQNFGKMGANVANAFTDTNGDGMVNIMDMGTFRQNFGKTAAKDCTVVFGA